MGSNSLYELMGAYSALDFGVPRNGTGDAGASINRALAEIAGRSDFSNGMLVLPPGTYNVQTTISLRSNIQLVGAGTATVLQLGTDQNVDVLKADSISNFRIRDLRINGNRSNNSSGTRQGLWLSGCQDGWIENVEAVSCRRDGFRLDDCDRIEMSGCKASDNGRHGISISFSRYCQIAFARCYDNSQVVTAGDGDGINLELLSSDNTIICPVSYETAEVGDRQGYGVREASGEGCARNLVLGGSLRGNRSGAISLDAGDSLAITIPLVQIPAGISITP